MGNAVHATLLREPQRVAKSSEPVRPKLSKTPHVLLTAFLPEQAGGLKHPHQPGSDEGGSAV